MADIPQIDAFAATGRQVMPMRTRRTGRFSWICMPLLVVIVLLVTLGLVVVYSAVSNNDNYSFSRQLIGVVFGFVIMLALWKFDYRLLAGLTTLFLIINIVLILSPMRARPCFQ